MLLLVFILAFIFSIVFTVKSYKYGERNKNSWLRKYPGFSMIFLILVATLMAVVPVVFILLSMPKVPETRPECLEVKACQVEEVHVTKYCIEQPWYYFPMTRQCHVEGEDKNEI